MLTNYVIIPSLNFQTMDADNQASENESSEVPVTDPDMEDFVNVSDAASRVLSVLRDCRNSQHSSASRLSLELSNSFAGVVGRRRARRSNPISRRGRGRRASFWRTHVLCLAQVYRHHENGHSVRIGTAYKSWAW